jgi:hypothetical protein
MQRHVPVLFEKIPDETLRCEKLFFNENIQVIARGDLVNHFSRLEQYVFCITITELGSLAFKVVELNDFSHTLNKDRNRWKEMVQWVHETTPTIMSEKATC